MRESRGDYHTYLFLGLVMLFWAGNSIVGRAVRDDIPPFTLAFVRWVGALTIVAPFAMRHVLRDREALRAGWRPVLILGVVGVAGFNGFLYAGLRETTATNGLLLQAAIPFMVMAFDAVLFRMRPGLWPVAGVALSTVGVAVIVFQADPSTLAALRFNHGDLLVLGGVVAWALYTSLLKRRPAIHPLSFLAVTFAIAAAVMLPFAATEWREIAAIDWRPEVIGAFAYVAVLPSVVAYFLYNAAVEVIGAARAAQTLSLMPLVGALLAALLLDEPLGMHHAIGMVLILAGITATAVMMRRSVRPRDARL